MLSAICFCLNQSKILLSGNGLIVGCFEIGPFLNFVFKWTAAVA